MTVPEKPLGARRREHHHDVVDALRRLEWDMHRRIWLDQRIPVEWHDIATWRESVRLLQRVQGKRRAGGRRSEPLIGALYGSQVPPSHQRRARVAERRPAGRAGACPAPSARTGLFSAWKNRHSRPSHLGWVPA